MTCRLDEASGQLCTEVIEELQNDNDDLKTIIGDMKEKIDELEDKELKLFEVGKFAQAVIDHMDEAKPNTEYMNGWVSGITFVCGGIIDLVNGVDLEQDHLELAGEDYDL